MVTDPTPRISVIIPTLNQSIHLGATISSVLEQHYPAIEIIVIDGGSRDESVEVIKRNERFIAYWVSEPDNGQTHAINKGMARATGQIRAYLNSDDLYLPDTLHAVAEYHLAHPEVDLIHGGCSIIDEHGNAVDRRVGAISTAQEALDLWGVWWRRRNFVQPEVFWTERIASKVGAFREDLYYVMDYEYWLRILLAGGRVGEIARDLAAFRLSPGQKSSDARGAADELLRVVEPYLWDEATPLPPRERLRLQARWLYDARFLATVRAEVEKGSPRWQRYVALLSVIAQHPKLLAGPGIYRRSAAVARGRFGSA